jgi:hypothetical protein
MSVTIDSLQLEIQSNSTNAASGIDGLAKALKNLKKNSDINDAVTSLNNLRKSLHAFVNMPSNASKIDSLTNSMKRLKKVGKIDLGNSLASVKRAMESLGTINVENVAPQIERIAGALAPLNNVKGGGFNSTVNGLKKLDDVVDSLDGGSIDRFVAKIKELDEKLTPVSKKLVAIGHAFKGVNTSAISAGKGVGTFRTSINATALNLTNFISVAQSAIAAIQPIIHFFSEPIKAALEWDGIVYQFGNAFGEQADIYYQKITEITDALGINKQTFMEISAMSTSMLKGFGVNSFDAREMGLGYAELAYDIWAAYGNKYKTIQDASDAISSAIAGEVEPIRRAGFTIVESQLEITAANHKVAYSAEKATEAQKSYLRYLTLVDQAHIKGIVGAYADEMDTAEGTVRTFTQQLKTLSQTFGAVFLPILVKVMPWLTAFVELIGDAIIAVASLFGVEIQKFNPEDFSGLGGIAEGAEQATNSVKDTTDALKDLKNATIGIDELNVISPPTANKNSGGSGAGGAGWDGLDVESLWDKKIWDDVQNQVDDIKERIKGMLPIIGSVAAAFAGWKLLDFLSDLDASKKKIGDLDIVVNTKKFGKNLVDNLKRTISGTSFAPIVAGIKTKITAALTTVGTALAGVSGWAWAAIAVIVGTLVLAIVDYDFTDIGYKIGNAIGKACRVVVDWVKEVGGPILDGIKSAFEWCKENITWENVKSFTAALFKKETWTEIIWPKMKEIGKSIWDGLWEGLTDGLSNLWGNITEFVDGFVQGFKDGFEIKSPSKKFIAIGEQLIAGLLEPFSFSSIKNKLSEFWNSVTNFFSGGKTEKVDVSVNLEKNGWTTIAAWIGKIPGVSQLVSLAKSGWSTVKKWVGNIPTVSQAVGLVKSGWSSVKSWVGTIPTFSAGIKLAKSGWSTIKSWLGSLDFKLNFKLPKIGINWGSKTVLGFKISYPSSFYTYAKGGFPGEDGQLFLAREAGPEMVGRIGNKNAVVNNEQIVDSVSEGVYAAVLAAMRQSETNGAQSVNVYLDGRQITSNVEKHQRERGATIMRNGVYAY